MIVWDDFHIVYVKNKPYVIFTTDKGGGKYMTTIKHAENRMLEVQKKHPERLELIYARAKILLADVVYRRLNGEGAN